MLVKGVTGERDEEEGGYQSRRISEQAYFIIYKIVPVFLTNGMDTQI